MPKLTTIHSRPKALYRVKNWSKYDKALVQRGSITFWLSGDFEKTWMYIGEKQRGSQFDYTDQAILVMLTVKEVFHLTNRGVEGFVRSLFQMMKNSFASARSFDLIQTRQGFEGETAEENESKLEYRDG
jgi:hypothetical protein